MTSNRELTIPAWIEVLAHLYKYSIDNTEPSWVVTSKGIEEALDMPYPTVAKTLKKMNQEGWVQLDRRTMVGKHGGIVKHRCARRAFPYKITAKGSDQFVYLKKLLEPYY